MARVSWPALLLVCCSSVPVVVSKDAFDLCVYGGNFGQRSGQFCYVFLIKQDYETPFRWTDAVKFCKRVGILADDFVLREPQSVKRKEETKEPLNGIKTQESRCRLNVTDHDKCRVVCKIATCPQGSYDPPRCLSTCQCKQLEYCDVITGACKNEKCSAGFYGPPLCWKTCSCLHDVTCDAVDGFCPFGCRQGWSGRDCKVRQCPAGFAGPPKCDHKCHCQSDRDCDVVSGSCEHGCASGWSGVNCTQPCEFGAENCSSCFCSDPHCKDPPGVCKCEPGWAGKLCADRKCPMGTFGPPGCEQTCHCESDRFCSPYDGDCHGTPCEDRWTGHSCQDRGCDPGYFGPPLCLFSCYCANGTCDQKTGICEHGCRHGWRGMHCNIRLCPEGTFGMPKCDLKCTCLSNHSCNSITGVCEGEECRDGLTGPYCNISAVKKPLASRYQTYSTPSDIAIPFFVVLVLVIAWVGFSVCSPPPRRVRGKLKAPAVSRQEADSPVRPQEPPPLEYIEKPESPQDSAALG